MAILLFCTLVFIVFAVFFYQTFLRDKLIRGKAFPEAWQQTLESSLPIYTKLSPDEQLRLKQLIQLFIAKKRFYGCAGLEITDQIRVTVAAEACLLILNHGWNIYPGLMSVLIYPSAFVAHREQQQSDGTVASGSHSLLGESWSNGKVILSWDDVERGVADFSDGQNVALHEFAHQLDGQSGSTNGAPPLRRNSYKSWATIFSDNFDDLTIRSKKNKKTVIDDYGTTNPAEFFAVATETFFEQPRELHKRRPELYEELQRYYQLDPRAWVDQ